MGAADFIQISKHPDVGDAFKRASDEAAFEHGHGGYSGTIAEKSGYQVIDRTTRTERAAYAFAQELLDDFEGPHADIVQDKWGPAAAIPVCLSVPEIERTIKAKVDVDPERRYHREDLAKILQAEGLVREGEAIDRVNASFEDRTRVQARRTEGKVVTRYFDADQHFHASGKAWIAGFATMAEWRKDAQERARDRGGRYECVGITRRFDTEPLDVVEAVVTKRTATIDAVLVRPNGEKLPVEGWLFFGYASC